jgi:hypothetical protein
MLTYISILFIKYEIFINEVKMRGTIRNPALVIIFGIITCGIYIYYWIYATSKEVKLYLDDPTISPGVELLLCIITCGIYAIYWWYKYGNLLKKAEERVGITSTNDYGILFLILILCSGFTAGITALIALVILQSKLNDVWSRN